MPIYSLPTQRDTKCFTFRLGCRIAMISAIVVCKLIASVQVYSEEPKIHQILSVVEVQQRQVITLKVASDINPDKVEAYFDIKIAGGKA